MSPSRSRSSGHLPGLDGLRAVAVAAVVAYHLGAGFLGGGFAGVEVFFVISGFLITTLLVGEWGTTGGIALRSFWLRRARRLLPALFALLLVTLAVAVVAFPDEIVRVRRDALAAIGYVTNWYLLVVQQPYFETVGRPSPLLHLWSLAIEEQFYLLWPILLAAALAIGRVAGAFALASVGLGASAVVALALYVPGTDPSRVYYGTDARSVGLLAGALVGLLMAPLTARYAAPPLAAVGPNDRPSNAATLGNLLAIPSGPRRSFSTVDLVSLVGLVALAAAFVVLDGEGEATFRGGLLGVDVATVLLIASVVTRPAAPITRLLELAPMRWLGTRSYSVYLWHWPVIVFTRPGLDLPLDSVAATALRLALTVALAEVSYRFVEQPLRSGALGRAVARLREVVGRGKVGVRPTASRPLALRLGSATLGSVCVAALLVRVAIATPPAGPSGLTAATVEGLVTPAPVATSAQPAVSSAPMPGAIARRPIDAHDAVSAAPTPTPAPTPPTLSRVSVPQPVLALGESVLIDAAPSLASVVGPLTVDARIGRQVADDIAEIETRAGAGTLTGTVILDIGNNGPIFGRDAVRLMDALKDVPLVLWINVNVPREWQDPNNALIAWAAQHYPNVRAVDWRAATATRPELFWKDGIHPTPAGGRVMASLVEAAVRYDAVTPP